MSKSKTTKQPGILYVVRCVRTEHGVRSYRDQRVRVTRFTYEYRDLATGEEYRKSFETKGTMPDVPGRGTSAEITAQQFQW